MMMFEDEAASPEALRLAREATEMARGGCLLADIDPRTEPTPGDVTCLTDEDGQVYYERRSRDGGPLVVFKP
jgi:hypothetical protein